ncbi:MAG: hypothetical protein K6T59_15260 [Bryobacteraceae bacterium]|nr:hypothetical protein [Bryobacteraceae bacterium]
MLVSNSNLSCNTSLDVTSTARTFYSDVWAFLSYRGLTCNIVVFGETSSNQTNFNCNLDTPQMTQQNANGYTQSTLFTSDGGNVRLRPWDDSRSANCTTPTLIGAPNGPYAP